MAAQFPPLTGVWRCAILTAYLVATGVQSVEPPRDSHLAMIAYSTLQNDPRLGDLNLGVRIQESGKAILWGELRSREQLQQAEQLLRRIPGIISVESECQIVPRDPFMEMLDQSLRKSPDELARSLGRGTPDTIAHRPAPASSRPDLPRHTTTTSKPDTTPLYQPQPSARLLPPELDENARTTSPGDRGPFAVYLREPRFSRLRLDVEKDRIFVRYLSDDAARAWELAKRLSEDFDNFVVVVGPQKR